MPAGYSKRSLVQKLGIKNGGRIRVIGEPKDYWTILGPLPDDVAILKRATSRPVDLIHIFVRRAAVLGRRLPALRGEIAANGAIWVSWPKQASGVTTDLKGNDVRGLGLACGLVDIKVCAIDETWSGLKFVIPVKDRPSAV